MTAAGRDSTGPMAEVSGIERLSAQGAPCQVHGLCGRRARVVALQLAEPAAFAAPRCSPRPTTTAIQTGARVEIALQILGTIGLATVVPVLLRARRGLRFTTLRTAWLWATAAWSAWAAVWIAELAADLGAGLADQLWYGVSVLALCPPIAVLGARRPGVRVWSWFVLAPLVLVFAWPALVEWNRDWEFDRLRIELPMLIGYGLVMVMGLGNYVGTRFTLAALWLGAAQLLLIAPFSAAVPAAFPEAERARLWAAICLAAAACSAAWAARRPPAAASALDAVWIDYRDWFGIVWARRFMDRVNDAARTENWPMHLEFHGLVTDRTPDPPEELVQATKRTEQAFRWLLRRFVDPEWIEERWKLEA